MTSTDENASDLEVPPIVDFGSGKSPEDRIEDERRARKRRAWVLAVAFAMVVAGLGIVAWIVLTA